MLGVILGNTIKRMLGNIRKAHFFLGMTRGTKRHIKNNVVLGKSPSDVRGVRKVNVFKHVKIKFHVLE
jgi:hypothetical protein